MDRVDKKHFYCYTIDGSNDAFVPMLATHSLRNRNENITKAIVAIHGLNENVFGTFNDVVAALGNSSTNTIVVVPWFHKVSVSGIEWGNSCSISSSMIWYRNDSWTIGGDSERYPSAVNQSIFHRTSSFYVLDKIFDDLASTASFPSIGRIIYSGFSAGGQMINRYSWASTVGNKFELKHPNSNYVHVRFIVSDGSSYLYLSPLRPSTSCCAMKDTGNLHSCSEFTLYTTIHSYNDIIMSGSNNHSVDAVKMLSSKIQFYGKTTDAVERLSNTPVLEITTCNEFDQWKYGTPMSGLRGEGYSYLQPFVDDPGLVLVHNQKFREKDIRYVFGEHDSCNCHMEGYKNPSHCWHSISSTSSASTTLSSGCTPSIYDSVNTVSRMDASTCCDTFPDALNNDLSTSCGAMLQGSNRLQRGLNYMAHLRFHFNSSIPFGVDLKDSNLRSFESKDQILTVDADEFPVYAVVPLLQHDSASFYKSDAMQRWVFDWNGQRDSSQVIHIDSRSDDDFLGVDVGTYVLVIIAGTLLLHFLYTSLQYFCSVCCPVSSVSSVNNRDGEAGGSVRRRQISNAMEPDESTRLL